MGAYESNFSTVPALIVDTLTDQIDSNYSTGQSFFERGTVLRQCESWRRHHHVRRGDSMAAQSCSNWVSWGMSEAATIDATSLSGGLIIDANQQSRILSIAASAGDVTLSGLTLTGGKTTGDNDGYHDTSYSGGAILSLASGVLTLDQTTVTGNTTDGEYADGGGIWAQGMVTLIGSKVSYNSTAGYLGQGGGVWAGVITISNSNMLGNSTHGTLAEGGGSFR